MEGTGFLSTSVTVSIDRLFPPATGVIVEASFNGSLSTGLSGMRLPSLQGWEFGAGMSWSDQVLKTAISAVCLLAGSP